MNSTTGTIQTGIKYHLFIRNKSQNWLAKQLGWSINKLSRRMTGKTSFDIDELDAIAGTFGIEFDDLLNVPMIATCEPVESATSFDVEKVA